MTFACQAPNPAPAGAWRTAKRNGPMAFRSASPLNRRGVGTYPRAHRILAYLQRHVQVAVRVRLVAERAAGQAKHAADVAGREGDLEAVGGRVGEPLDAVGPEVVVLALLAVGDDRRAGRLEARDGIP